MAIIVLVIFGVSTLLGMVAFVAWRYQRVPTDRVLVVYGRLADGSGAQLFHAGGALVLPIVQGHAWLDAAHQPRGGGKARRDSRW